MKDKDKLKKGVVYAVLTAIISGIAIFYSKISVAKIPPLILTTSRNLYVALLFIFLFIIRGHLGKLKKLTKKQLLFLFLIGLIGGSLPFYLFFTGLSLVNPQTANLIHKTLFLWVTFLAVIFLKEKLNLPFLISFFLIFTANFLWAKLPLSFGFGEGLILLATLLWATENVLAKKILKEVSSEMVGLFRMTIGSTILLSLIFLQGKEKVFLTFDWPKLTIVLVGGTILFFYVFFWYKALKYAPASLATLILSFSTVVGNLLNGAFIKVKLLPNDIFSSILITLAIFVIFQISFFSKKLALKR